MSPNIATTMSFKQWLLLLILSILWGGSFFLVEIAIATLPTFTIVLLRVSVAAMVLWLFVWIMGIAVSHSLTLWRRFLIMGLLNNVLPFCLIVWGQTHIDSGLASILNATTPLFAVVVASSLLVDEKVTGNKLLGVIIGFVGTVVMLGESALAGIGTHFMGQLAVLAAALCYAFAGVYGRRFKSMDVHPIVAATGQLSCSSLFLIPIVGLVDGAIVVTLASWQSIIAVIALALFSTAFAYVLYFYLLAAVGVTNLLLVTFLIPISAILLGTVILAEILQLTHVVGMSIIAVGLLAIDGRFVNLMQKRFR